MARKVITRTAAVSSRDFAWVKWNVRDVVRIAHAAERAYADALARVTRVQAKTRTFANTVHALDRADAAVQEAYRKIEFLLQVHPDARMRTIAHKTADRLLERMLDLSYDEGIYRALIEYQAKRERPSASEQKLFTEMLRDARRMGFELTRAKRTIYQRITKRLAMLSSEFQKNINEYDDGIWVTQKELAGLSERYIAGLRRDARGRYYVSLAYPEIFPFLEQAENAIARKMLLTKHYRRGGARNVTVLREMVRLRHRAARLLGYPNHAAFQLEVRMAKRPATVRRFIMQLMRKLAPGVRKDRALLERYKQQSTKDPHAHLEFFDGAFYANKYKQEHLRVDVDVLREYFPLATVRAGMFGIYERLFGIRFKKVTRLPAWHRDAEWYAVQERTGGVVGYIVLDLHPRTGKYGHAAVFPLVETRRDADRVRRAPICALVCNFPKPAPGRPSLLSHDEVETLFHEFGHAVHHALSQAPFDRQAGTRTALDFVEAPSQMLENWVWDTAMLRRLSGHYRDRKRKIPPALVRHLVRTKKFMIATWATRQLVLALYDHLLHTKSADSDVLALHPRLMQQYLHTALPPRTRFGAGFGHLGGGYDAGYYGYMWSNLYAADMFTRFTRGGLLSVRTGMDYRREILEPGSSREELDSVRAFLGREPNDKALLHQLGLHG